MAKFDDKINKLLNEFTTGMAGMMKMSSDNLEAAPGWKYVHDEDEEGSKPDYLDFDNDGDKKEPMKKALRQKKGKDEDAEDMTGKLSDKALVRKVKKSPGKVAGYTIAAAEKELKDKGSLSAKMRKALARDEYEDEDAEDKNWIQKAEKDIEKRGTEGVCTGKKFGGPTCRPGTKRYNLAKTFRKMAKDK